MEDGEITTVTCPEPNCDEKLIYREDAAVESLNKDPLHIPIERHFYECPKHGHFRYHGDGRFSRAPISS